MATDLRIEADNRPGVLAAIGEQLGTAGVNIDGFCAVVSDGHGYLHLLVESAGAARTALADAGFPVAVEREALVIDPIEDRPGALGEVSRKLADAGVNVEVGYLATGTRLVLVVDDVERASAQL